MQSSMIYIVIMAIAFVAFVCLLTLLIVTRKKEKDDYYPEEDDEDIAPVRKREKVPQRREELPDDGYASRMAERADFGYTETNPVFTSSTAASERYLSALRTGKGEGLRWIREGTVTVKRLNQISNANVEFFTLYLYGREFKKIYICPLGKNSNKAPEGLMLANDGKRLSYNGSIALEAKEKGITEEQVLKKYALVYENRRAGETTNKKAAASGTERKENYKTPEPVSYREEKRPVQDEKDYGRPGPEKSAREERSSFPKYLPGFEPEEMKPALEKFLAVMDREYPDGVIQADTWDHARWDRAASMLCRYLGYSNGSEFLEAYGYTVEK